MTYRVLLFRFDIVCRMRRNLRVEKREISNGYLPKLIEGEQTVEPRTSDICRCDANDVLEKKVDWSMRIAG